MEVYFTPKVQAQLNELSADTGRPQDAIVNEILAAYLDELTEAQRLLNRRYDDVKSSRIVPVEGRTALRQLLAENVARRTETGDKQ